MTDIKLPLERIEINDLDMAVESAAVAVLERAYAELQERCSKAEKERNALKAEVDRLKAHIVELGGNTAPDGRHAGCRINERYAQEEIKRLKAEVERLKQLADDGCEGKCLGEMADELKRLKRIEAAAKAWLAHVGGPNRAAPGADKILLGPILDSIIDGIGPDGEVKP